MHAKGRVIGQKLCDHCKEKFDVLDTTGFALIAVSPHGDEIQGEMTNIESVKIAERSSALINTQIPSIAQKDVRGLAHIFVKK